MKTLIAVDPGRDKCGLAVVSGNGPVHMAVVQRGKVIAEISSLVSRHVPERIIVGNGTGGSALVSEIRASVSSPVELVDETLSSRRARERFFRDNPPTGLKRLVPRGLLIPPRPCDDYVALILAEDYLEND